MKPIQIEKGVILYCGNRVGQLIDGCAKVDPMFQREDLSEFLEWHPDIREVRWEEGMFERLMDKMKTDPEQPPLKDCRVWQLKPDVNIRMKFIGYEELCHLFGSPDLVNYEKVYEGAVKTNDLEELYELFNIQHPEEFTGHSLSMSDILELYDDSGSTFHYVDWAGFQEVDLGPADPNMECTQSM